MAREEIIDGMTEGKLIKKDMEEELKGNKFNMRKIE